jgi:hypothetical protein
MINFKDLETKGFVVIKNFLSADQLDYIKNDYNRQKDNEVGDQDNKNYLLTYGMYPFLISLVQSTINLIDSQTNLTVNITRPVAAFFDNQMVTTIWHQDPEPYYMFQDLYNALNFWIPIIKPDPCHSGISIVPHDVLQKTNPEVFNNQIVGKGAMRYQVIGSKTKMINDNNGVESLLPVNINNLSVSPELAEGDAIILRQDILHKTQDMLTNRAALSIRCYNKDTVLSRDHFLTRCKKKNDMISNNPYGYKKFVEKFVNENLDHILISDIIKT